MLKFLFVLASTLAALGAQTVDKSDPTTVMTVERQARKARAVEWLASGDPLKVAWGASTVRADRQADLVPALIDRIREYRSSGFTPAGGFALDQHDAMLQVLDALIELKAPVPPEEARKLYPEFVAQSVILLVRAGDKAVSELMEVFDTAAGNTSWLAAGNALLGAHAEGFGAKVLGRYTQHLQVTVFSPNRGVGGSGGGWSGGSTYAPPSKPNWPSGGLYALTQTAEPSAVYLAEGPTPIYYTRVESGTYLNPGEAGQGNRDTFRGEYLGRMRAHERNSPYRGPVSSTAIDAYPRERVAWTGGAGYRDELGAQLEKATNTFRYSLRQLGAKGWISEAEAQLIPLRLEVLIEDARDDKSIPLPPPDPRPGVAFVTHFQDPLR